MPLKSVALSLPAMRDLFGRLGPALLQDEPLAKYTAARLGGPADWLYVARESLDDLVQVVSTAWAHDIPLRVIGGGANVLVSDRGIRGLTVINRVSQVEFGAWSQGQRVSVTGGTSLSVLANRCQRQGLAGMGWAVNVPGTVGGAGVNNAGAHDGDMADSVKDAVVLEPDGAKIYSNAELAYDYRHSMLKARADRRFLVLLVTLMLRDEPPPVIRKRMQGFIQRRKASQPPGASLGSIFKNPPGDYAGRLIEAAGLKGYAVGGVMVSPVHANFVVNTGDGTATDYDALIRQVQTTVAQKFEITLELEIERIGDW